ncbi:hypothetical protein D3C86_1548230 [compost metagenome]
MIGGISAQLLADGGANLAARAIAPYKVTGADLDRLPGVSALQDGQNGVSRMVIAADVDKLQVVIRFQAPGQLEHAVEQVVLDACLVDDDVGEFRQAMLCIFHPTGTFDALTVICLRPPERRFIDPIRFAYQLFGEPEGVEHFNGSASDPVSLPQLQATTTTFDDARCNAWESGQLCRQ